tara:strand:- start:215 stop:382 length:168 start_codon:yes stop_codon:yes gene_type:complete
MEMEEKQKQSFLNLIEVFLRLINVLRSNPDLFPVSPPTSLIAKKFPYSLKLKFIF